MTETMQRAERAPAEVAVAVVDADVHPAPRSAAELGAYLPEPWRSQEWPKRLFSGGSGDTLALYTAPGKAQRGDAHPPGGGPPCSDPAFTERQLFGDAAVDMAILIPLTAPRPMANPEHEAAAAAATNAWLATTWLSRYNGHGRYRGTLRVGTGSAELAVREIERWAGHAGFVQVMLNPYVRAPLGQPQYYPIYEAAARHDLPVAVHVNRGGGMALLTPLGYVSYFWEHHALYPLLFATHLASLLCEGVFERFPTLTFVFVEGGFGWFLPLLWRLDKHWHALRSEIPALRRRPSDYVREHIRFTSQPIEEPQEPAHLTRVLEWLDAERILLFATDYPHWDGDYDPKRLFRGLSAHARQRILCENARELYRLPPARPADGT
ncbi:MAG: amidohydrolase [Chloroflexi bacterium]|nr:amidohydrolase [Chloroflexota bacterium]